MQTKQEVASPLDRPLPIGRPPLPQRNNLEPKQSDFEGRHLDHLKYCELRHEVGVGLVAQM